jgi:hypothetical protein
MGRRDRGRELAELFRDHSVELTHLAVASGASSPADGLVDAYADLYEKWRDVDDPLLFLRRRAVSVANPVSHVGAVRWLRAETTLNDETIADVIGVSPAEVTVIGNRHD